MEHKKYKEHDCPNGVKIRIATTRDDVAQYAFAFYDRSPEHLMFVCPFCGNDDEWDNLTYERDGDQCWDTYTCAECETLITIITPYELDYHEVLACETSYEIEFMNPGHPYAWPDDLDEEIPGLLKWPDQNEVPPDQIHLF